MDMDGSIHLREALEGAEYFALLASSHADKQMDTWRDVPFRYSRNDLGGWLDIVSNVIDSGHGYVISEVHSHPTINTKPSSESHDWIALPDLTRLKLLEQKYERPFNGTIVAGFMGYVSGVALSDGLNKRFLDGLIQNARGPPARDALLVQAERLESLRKRVVHHGRLDISELVEALTDDYMSDLYRRIAANGKTLVAMYDSSGNDVPLKII